MRTLRPPLPPWRGVVVIFAGWQHKTSCTSSRSTGLVRHHGTTVAEVSPKQTPTLQWQLFRDPSRVPVSHTDIGAGPLFLIWADVLRYAFGFEVMFVVKFQVGFVGLLFLREVCEVYDSGVLVEREYAGITVVEPKFHHVGLPSSGHGWERSVVAPGSREK